MNGYRNQYQQNQILTASPEQILVMLYDGAIRFCKQAAAAEKEHNTSLKLEKISKAFAIITEFSNSLNHDIGGEIAADLDGLYQFMLRELTQSRESGKDAHLETVTNMLVDLRQTWMEAIEINRKEQCMLAQRNQDDSVKQTSSEKYISAAG